MSVLFLHHLKDLVLVRRGKKLGNTVIRMGDRDGMGEGFGNVSLLWYLIWKGSYIGSERCVEKGSLLSHLAGQCGNGVEILYERGAQGRDGGGLGG